MTPDGESRWDPTGPAVGKGWCGMPRLVPPGDAVHASFVEAVREHVAAGEPVPLGPDVLAHPVGFHALLAMLGEEAREDDPARPGRIVPQTTWWWCHDDRYLGRVSLRHRLNRDLEVVGGHIGYDVRPGARRQGHATAMLAAALPLAHGRGIDPALVTCDVTNTASRRVIEAAGGVPAEPLEPQTLRFWVPTS